MGVSSTRRLVAALKSAGAPIGLVLSASRDEFHDFRSPSATPIIDLVNACEIAGLRDIADRAKGGEFDADKAEADKWANSPEGRAAMSRPRVSDTRIRDALAAFAHRRNLAAQSSGGIPVFIPEEQLWLDLRDSQARIAELEAALDVAEKAGRRLVGAVEACAVGRYGGPPVNWEAVDASQDAMRDALTALAALRPEKP